MYKPPISYNQSDSAFLGDLDSTTLNRLAAWFQAQADNVRSYAMQAHDREKEKLLRSSRIDDRISMLISAGARLMSGEDRFLVCSQHNLSDVEAELAVKIFKRHAKRVGQDRSPNFAR